MNCKHLVLSIFSVVLATQMVWAETMVHTDLAVSLADLLDNQVLSVGDKTFSNFTYTKVGDMPAAQDVSVIPLQSDGDYGIRFQAGFVDRVGGGVSDSLITFSVEAPAALIDAASLAADATAAGNGVATITETFLPELSTTLMTISAGANLDDSVTFGSPLQKLNVQKDILLLADTEDATISYVDQIFRQIPEPSSGTILAAGILALHWRPFRRRLSI